MSDFLKNIFQGANDIATQLGFISPTHEQLIAEREELGSEYSPARPSTNYYEHETSANIVEPRIFMDYMQVPLPQYQITKADSLFNLSLRSWKDNRGQTEIVDKQGGVKDVFQEANRHSSIANHDVTKILLKQDYGSDKYGLERINRVNTTSIYVNDAVTYQFDDNENIRGVYESRYGGSLYIPSYDDFKSSQEILDGGVGDCDDQAIVKYDLLAAQGVPEEEMHIVVGWQHVSNPIKELEDSYIKIGDENYGAHAMLIVEDPQKNTYYVMDNNPQSRFMISNESALMGDVLMEEDFSIYEEVHNTKFFIPVGSFNRFGSATFTTTAENDPIHEVKQRFGEAHSTDINDFYKGYANNPIL